MSKRDLTSIQSFSIDNVERVYELSASMKADLKAGRPHRVLEGDILSLLFEKPSLRTRMTFEVGIYQLGGIGITQVSSEVGIGKRESVHDVARNLERWVHLVMIRTYEQKVVEELAQYASVPVINALTDWEHPCQALADLFTLSEHRGALKGLNLTFVGDGNNICQSLLLLCPMLGVNITVASPESYTPDATIVAAAQATAARTGATVTVTHDPMTAVAKADAIYTDVWASMGQEDEQNERLKIFQPFQVNADLVARAPQGALIMHDLPAHRGEEITDAVIDSPESIVFDQAENRLHVQKGIMVFLRKG